MWRLWQGIGVASIRAMLGVVLMMVLGSQVRAATFPADYAYFVPGENWRPVYVDTLGEACDMEVAAYLVAGFPSTVLYSVVTQGGERCVLKSYGKQQYYGAPPLGHCGYDAGGQYCTTVLDMPRTYYCPGAQTPNSAYMCNIPDDNDGMCPVLAAEPDSRFNDQQCLADPINTITGAMYLVENDYRAINGSLMFSRYYHSRKVSAPGACYNAILEPRSPGERTTSGDDIEANRPGKAPRPSAHVEQYALTKIDCGVFSGMKGEWRHNYSAGLLIGADDRIVARRPDGRSLTFVRQSDGVFRAGESSRALLIMGDAVSPWILREGGIEESYNAAGRLIKIKYTNGREVTLSYAASGMLIAVTDEFGRSLHFAYYSSSDRLAAVILPDGQKISYEWNTQASQMTAVVWPDGTPGDSLDNPRKTYQYTGEKVSAITDEKGVMYSSWAYDAAGRATMNMLAGGVERYDVDYSVANKVIARDAAGLVTQRNVYTTAGAGFRRNGGAVNQLCTGAECQTVSTTSAEYDSGGRISRYRDRLGTQYEYTRDSLGRELTRTEAAGTAQERKTTTEWHTTFNMPLRIASANKRVINTYDNNANVLTHSEQASTDNTGSQGFAATVTGPVRSWTYTYNSFGQMLTADGPRSDSNDVITYSYYPADDSDINRRGNLASVTNALGQVTQYPSWNANGSPLTMIDANNISTTFAYDARNRLTSRSRNGEATQFEYDPVGQLIKVTLPDGNYLQYSYDDAHRQTRISDKAGNYIEYGYDLMSRRIKEEIHDNVPAGGGLQQQLQRIEEWLRSVTPQPGAEALAEAA